MSSDLAGVRKYRTEVVPQATARARKARLSDIRELAMAMPHVTILEGRMGNPIYQVGGKSFIFFRTPRPDATDPKTGERYDDVIVFWVPTEADKHAMVQDRSTPYFTTSHFDGHTSVLLRAAHVGELSVQQLAELVEDAWLSRTSASRAANWLESHPRGAP